MNRFKSKRSSQNTEDISNVFGSLASKLGKISPFESVLVYDYVDNPDVFKNKKVKNLRIDPTKDPDATLKEKVFSELTKFTTSNNVDELYKNERELKDTVYFDIMPANSIIGYNLQNSEESLEVFFPFFPHLALPVKAGEVVWVFYEHSAGRKLGYWVSRKCGTRFVEDVNFTDISRQTFVNAIGDDETLKVFGSISEKDYQKLVYSFGKTLDMQSSKIDDKKDTNLIAGTSVSYNEQFKGAYVPRHPRKCGDLSLQGSNNTLVNLTHIDNNNTGRVEIIVGRGKETLNNPPKVRNKRNLQLKSFEYTELDKTYEVTGKFNKKYPNEGLIDEQKDPVHVYFQEELPDGILNQVLDIASDNLESGLIPEPYQGHINFRVNTDTNDYSFLRLRGPEITIESNGLNLTKKPYIELESEKIYLGRSARQNIAGLPSENDPYVKYSTLKPLLDKILNSILVLQAKTSGEAFVAAQAAIVAAAAASIVPPTPLVDTALEAFGITSLTAASAVNQQTTVGIDDLVKTGNAITAFPLGSTKVFGE